MTARAAAHLRGGAAAPRTRGSSGRPPPRRWRLRPCSGPGTWGRGAAGVSRTRPRADGGSPSAPRSGVRGPRRPAAGGGAGVRSAGSRGPRRQALSREAAPAPAPRAPRQSRGRSGRRPPRSPQCWEAEAPVPPPRLPHSGAAPRFAGGSGPPTPGSVRHCPTIPPAQGHAGDPALPRSSGCAGRPRAGAGSARARERGGLASPAPPTSTRGASGAPAPLGDNGLSRNKPWQPNAQALPHTRRSLRLRSKTREIRLQRFPSHSLLVAAGLESLSRLHSSSSRGSGFSAWGILAGFSAARAGVWVPPRYSSVSPTPSLAAG